MIKDPTVEVEQQLGGKPALDILGAVSANGVGGGKFGQAEHWQLAVVFAAWRVAGGRMQTKPLRLVKRVSQQQLRAVMAQIKAFDVIRVRASLAEPGAEGKMPQSLLVEIIGKDSSDVELNKFVKELQKPVTFEDPRFGTFTLARRIDWFEAKTIWISTPIRLTIHNGSPEEMKSAFELAYALWNAKELWNQSMAEYAAKELLDLLNDNWLPEGEAELSAKEFEAKIRLESIDIRENGKFDFWYDDSNLFAGHAIRVEGSFENGPEQAGIEG